MATYKATFSTGRTATRTSDHDYRTAGAYVNQKTGETTGPTFSATTPKETRDVFIPISRRIEAAMGRKYIERAKAANEAAAKVWKWEVVEVEIIKA